MARSTACCINMRLASGRSQPPFFGREINDREPLGVAQNPAYAPSIVVLPPAGVGGLRGRKRTTIRQPTVIKIMLILWRNPMLRWALAALCGLVAAAYATVLRKIPSAPAGGSTIAIATWPAAGLPSSVDWEVFRRGAVAAPGVAGELGKRFRLAGTFFSFSEAEVGDGNFCKAILDDVQRREQYLVKEADTVADGVEIVRIYRDRIVLRRGGQEEELWLSFSGPQGASPSRQGSEALGALTAAPALEENRFGKRVGETRWVLSRQALMSYYDELREDPERIAALYVSMKPKYADGSISGYVLDMQGEKDFFEAAGLRNGDVVRKVNSLEMTSQKRAEYFIGEFARNRLNAVVLDVERDGQSRKQIYLIR